ncbi:hypothetical protein M8J75_009712 [Diaphorina citri]|nr:hypothetical protein M8J75_009712 [Diaphorina citri]
MENKELQGRLLVENPDLKQVIATCQAVEMAASHQRTLQREIICAVKTKADVQYKQQNVQKRDELFDCNRCKTTHGARNCPAYGKECHKCGRVGHFQIACRSSKFKKYNPQKRADESQKTEDRAHPDDGVHGIIMSEDMVLHLDSVGGMEKFPREIYTTLDVAGNPIRFKVDTGSCVNIIPESLLEVMNVLVHKTEVQFEAYGGSKIVPLGYFKADCSNKNKSSVEEFFVCKTETPILGLQTIIKYDIIQINETKPVWVDTPNKANNNSTPKTWQFHQANSRR